MRIDCPTSRSTPLSSVQSLIDAPAERPVTEHLAFALPCSLTLEPNVVTVPLSTVKLEFGLADRDGGVNVLCYGITAPPTVPDPNRCRPFAPTGAPINRRESFRVTLPPLARGTYTFAIVVNDTAGNWTSTALQVL